MIFRGVQIEGPLEVIDLTTTVEIQILRNFTIRTKKCIRNTTKNKQMVSLSLNFIACVQVEEKQVKTHKRNKNSKSEFGEVKGTCLFVGR